ncbi:MAG: glycoside hydrolase family 3 protein, partial [Bacteroidia bacterium]
MKKIIFTILIFISIVSFSFIPKAPKQDPPFLLTDTRWADSVFKALSPDERIAQLFMVAAYSNKDKTHVKEIKKLVDE